MEPEDYLRRTYPLGEHWTGNLFAVRGCALQMKQQDQRVQTVTAPTTVTNDFRDCNCPVKEHGGDKKRQRTTKETLLVLQQQAASTAT